MKMHPHKGHEVRPRGRPRGRPPRIDRDAIAVAALEIGLEHASVRAVADRLGMSVPGLYHHVQGREDIARLAVEHSQRDLPLPEDTGQHWALWLWDYGCFVHDALVEDSEIIRHLLAGEFNEARAAEHRRRVVGFLRGRGFTAVEAEGTYQDVQTCALGLAATHTQRQSSSARAHRDGRVPMATLHTLLVGVGAGRGQAAAVRRALGSRGDRDA